MQVAGREGGASREADALNGRDGASSPFAAGGRKARGSRGVGIVKELRATGLVPAGREELGAPSPPAFLHAATVQMQRGLGKLVRVTQEATIRKASDQVENARSNMRMHLTTAPRKVLDTEWFLWAPLQVMRGR